MKGEVKQLPADWGIFYLYLSYIFILPLPFGGDRPWSMAIYQLLVYVMMAWWLVLYLRDKISPPAVISRARAILILLVIWLGYILWQDFWPRDSTASGLVSQAPYMTSAAWFMSLAYALTFVLTLLLVNSRPRIIWLCGTIVLCGVLQALYGSLMTLSGIEYSFFVEKETYRGLATGTFYNRNHFAAYLVMCLSIGIGLMISRLDTQSGGNFRHHLQRWLKLILSQKLRLRLYLVIMVIALVLSRSRMANIAFFISLMGCGVVGLILSRHASRGMVVLLSSLIIIDVLIIGTWFGIDKVAERLENTTIAGESRVDVNRDSLPLVRQSPWTGHGLGSFPMVYPGYKTLQTGHGVYRQAHNDYLQFAIETGAIGLLLLAGIVLTSLLMAVVAQYKRRDPLMRGLSFAVMMGLSAMLIHATVEFNFQIPPNAAMFMVLLGLAWISRYQPSQDKNRQD